MAKLLDGDGEFICELRDLHLEGRVTNMGTRFSAVVPSGTGDDLVSDQEMVTIEMDGGERYLARVLQHGEGPTAETQRVWGTARTAGS